MKYDVYSTLRISGVSGVLDRNMADQDHIDRLIAKWGKECPEYDLTPVQIIGRIGRIYEYVDRALEAKFAESDISRASFDVLASLKRVGPPYSLTQRELMKNLLRTSGSISVRIDGMEREGLVTRETNVEDRRATLVKITKKGIDLLEAIVPEHLLNEERLLSGLSSQDRKELIRLLRKWNLSFESEGNDQRFVHYGMVVLDPRVSLQRRRAVGLPDSPGVLVHAIEAGGIADGAGLRRGDLIVAIEGVMIERHATLRKMLNQVVRGSLRFEVLRGVDAIAIKLVPESK
jgi:DNA-binding MarR family transcriptional regulator